MYKFKELLAKQCCIAPTCLSFAQNQPQICAPHDPEPKRKLKHKIRKSALDAGKLNSRILSVSQ